MNEKHLRVLFFMERIYSTEIVNNEKITLVNQHDIISNIQMMSWQINVLMHSLLLVERLQEV